MPFVLRLRFSPDSLTPEMGGTDMMKAYPDLMWLTTQPAPKRGK